MLYYILSLCYYLYNNQLYGISQETKDVHGQKCCLRLVHQIMNDTIAN